MKTDNTTPDGVKTAEEWRDVCGYESHYEINNIGIVRSKPRVMDILANGKKPYKRVKNSFVLKPQLMAENVYGVTLSKDGKESVFSIRKLIKDNFIEAKFTPDIEGVGELEDVIKEHAYKIFTDGDDDLCCSFVFKELVSAIKGWHASKQAAPKYDCNKCEDVGTVMFGMTWNYCDCKNGSDLKSEIQAAQPQDNSGFTNYIKAQRESFSDNISEDWNNLSIDVRVQIENLLIAYDQMAERLTPPTH